MRRCSSFRESGPKDRYTWILEVAPAIVAAVVLIATYRRFPLTPLAYRLIFLHACILMLGGHYTYAEVPLGFWVRDLFGLARNHYDRLGHFAQGFVPAIVAREILLRKTPLKPGGWVFFLVTCICLAISALLRVHRVVDGARLRRRRPRPFSGRRATSGTRSGTCSSACVGALTAQLTLSRVHDRELARLGR